MFKKYKTGVLWLVLGLFLFPVGAQAKNGQSLQIKGSDTMVIMNARLGLHSTSSFSNSPIPRWRTMTDRPRLARESTNAPPDPWARRAS